MINIKHKRTTRWSKPVEHRQFGIQKWLVSRKYCQLPGTQNKNKCDFPQYETLLKSFCLYKKPDFIPKEGFASCEVFVEKNFADFASYCCNIYFKKI